MAFEYTKEELSAMRIGELKDIAKKYKVTGFSKYKASNKQELADLLWLKLGDGSVKPSSKSKKPRPKPMPKPKTKSPVKNKKTKKINYEFDNKELMNINVNLDRYDNSKIPPPTSDDITPAILDKLIKDNDFCRKVAKSLRDIYKAKDQKYKILEEKTKKSLKNDKDEKQKMKYAVDDRDLEKMFPMIPVNQAFLIKIEAMRKLAQDKHKQFSRMDTSIIKTVRKNLSDALNNEDDGIISISGERRKSIRNQLCKQLFILSKGYRPFMDAFINMVFTGPAGVGKTKLAKAVGFVYEKSGILLRGDVIIVSPKDMVAEYVGHTAGKAAGVLMKGLESIVFIDEAYQIMPCTDGKIQKDSKSFGPEAITEIVNFLDKYVGLSIMIVAGYQREIDGCFMAANEGLPRRFPIRLQLPSYTSNDLLNIFLNEATRRLGENIFTKEISQYIFTLLVKLDNLDDEIFINQAGDIMNLVSMFLNSYYGSYKIQWGKFDSDILIVNGAFNQFLKNKGYVMHIN